MATHKFNLAITKQPLVITEGKPAGSPNKHKLNLPKPAQNFLLNWRSLRFQLIGWYLLLLVLTLLIFSIYIFFQFRNLEQTQQDNTLRAAASQIQPLLEQDRPTNGKQPTSHIRTLPDERPLPGDLSRSNTQVRIFDADGKLVDSSGALVSDMPGANTLPTKAGFATLTTADGGQWRVYTQPLILQGKLAGWLQVGQPVYLLDTGFNTLFTPIVLGTLVALLLAVFGGLFLANRALKPIAKVTNTAQTISTRDLSRRINYNGPADEIGRLAITLDQMFDRLEKGFEQERRFTSDASHELRTPLTALKGRLEVALSRPRSTAEYTQTLSDLSQEVERLVRLSNSLLYLARLDQQPAHLQTERVDLSELVAAMGESLQPMAELKEIKLAMQIADNLVIPGNVDQLTRLFLNLIDNAIKYTSAGGQVVVQAGQVAKDNKVYVSVSDSGVGIAPEHLPLLFDRFYRVASDRASASGGAGLGLAIAHEIVRQHAGELTVDSVPGQGSIFNVILPM